MSPTGGADIEAFSAEGLPPGLEIDANTGVISGTPDTANAETPPAAVTVSDTAGNTASVDIAFPAVAKGDQTLAGFEYSASSVAFGDAAPTVTAPTGAVNAVTYSAIPATVCTVDPSTGTLTIVDAGGCEVTATAAGGDNYNEATATFTVAVRAAGELVLHLNPIADDDTVNIAEQAAGFAIAGDTGSEGSVSVTVTVGETELAATSDAADPAAWSVDVPADAAYIAGVSVDVVVSATKTGYIAPEAIERALTIDLTAPTPPAYTAPASLKVGEPITAMDPTGGADIDAYSAEGLPPGLSIDADTGVVSGTPDTANADTAAATVTVSDTAGNTASVDIAFPAVDKADQTLAGFEYSSSTVEFGEAAPTVTAPTGAVNAVSYSAAPAAVCTVDAATGALTPVGAGACVITATAAGDANYNEATATYTVTLLGNNAPVFSGKPPRTLVVAENTAADTPIGAPFTATDEEGHVLSYALEGADADSFAIHPDRGQLRTLAALDHETKARYSLTVKADDGRGGTAGIALTVTVTDVNEQPGTPPAPTALAAPGTTTSLGLRWSAPDANGGPAITGYAVQYRVGANDSWRNRRHTGTDTRATVTGLAAATDHQARIRALNGETPGEWSEPGSGSTGRPANTAPAFDSGLTTALTVDENTAAGANLGVPFTATDADGDTLTYLLEGADRRAFTIDAGSGQLGTRAALDHEAKSSYLVTVRADDGNGGADRIAVTVGAADIDERAGTPAKPLVLAASGSSTSLEVNWSAPDADGGPAIAGYEVQYREGEQGGWTDHRHRGTGTRTAIGYLNAGSPYQARVRALNGETPGEWSEPGSGRTGDPVNSPPVFDARLPAELAVDENIVAGADIGIPFTAGDTDEDALTYLLEGADRRAFTIDADSGQLRTRAALDYEAKSSYWLRVRAYDGKGGADSIRVRVMVADLDEKAPALSAPGVLATPDSTISLDLHWSAPDANGGPAITGYEVQYREGTTGDWIDHPQQVVDTRATIAELTESTAYRARVRALNGETPGDWSEPGSGRTGATQNSAPVFDDGLPASLTVDENTAPDTDLGAPFSATDADGDILTYLLDGSDRRAFTIDADSGQLRTRAPLDHETRDAYSLSVRVSDGAGGAATIEVMVMVADLHERAAEPRAPWVLATPETTTSLDVRWRPADANGGPAITGYEVQYRQGTDGAWIPHAHEDAGTRATIAELAAATDYQARVRALNGEAPGDWSLPGAGNTGRDANSAPEFSDGTATRSVLESSPAGDPIGIEVTAVDRDRDILTYTLEGTDAGSFDIDPQTGQILARAALDYEAKATHSVTVVANDGNGGAGTIEVTIEVIDAQEEQTTLGPAAPTGVTLRRKLHLDAGQTLRAELLLEWNAHADEDIEWFEFRLGRYPESSNGLAPRPFQCAGNRPFEADGWRRIPDRGPEGGNQRFYRFDARALGCHVLPDTFELRAQVRAVSSGADGAAPRASAPSTEGRMRDEAPRVMGSWLDATDLNALAVGDELVFVVAFSEPVRVATAGGSPSLGISLGEQARQARFARVTRPPAFRNYGSGHIGRRIEFRYQVQEGDELVSGIMLPANAVSISGGAAIVDATGAAGHAADLRSPRTTISRGSTVLAASPEESLTASFEADSVRKEHDGETAFNMQISFSLPAANGAGGLEGLTLGESAFLVTGGQVTLVSQLVAGENGRWVVGIEPDSKADVSISLGPTLDCAGEGAVCAGDGRRLANNIHAVVKGPPGLSVADARAAEGPDATMDFVVTLSRALQVTVTVAYATSDDTATAGVDYTRTSGTLTFEAGETSRTVAVRVLDDAHDDDGETFTLTLSNAAGGNAYLAHGTATGTIQNSDPMPKAWITRFGRTVSDHVIDAIQARLAEGPRETHLTLGGLRVDGFSARARQRPPGAVGDGAWPGEPAWRAADGGFGFAGGNVAQASAYAAGDSGSRTLSLREMVMGSSFSYSSGDGTQDVDARDAGGLQRWSVWGRAAATRFQGQDGPLTLDGEVSTAMLGVDMSWRRWLAGLVLAYSEGEGDFEHATASGGSVTSTLTSLHPFARYRFNERISVWGMVGYGVGDLLLTPEGADAGVETDLRMATAALGGRGVLTVRTGAAGSFELAVRSDAVLTETASGASENLLSASGATSRVRMILESRGSLPLSAGGALTPTLETGLRYDGGDADTGFGFELGGSLGYSVGGLSAQMRARLLEAHEDAGYEEWGMSGSLRLRYQPGAGGRGVKLSLGSDWGATQSGVQSMWARQPAPGLLHPQAAAAGWRFEAELGYGIQQRESLWTPFLALQSAEGGEEAARFGLQFETGTRLEAVLEIGRRQGRNGLEDTAIELRGRYRW